MTDAQVSTIYNAAPLAYNTLQAKLRKVYDLYKINDAEELAMERLQIAREVHDLAGQWETACQAVYEYVKEISNEDQQDDH